MKKKRGTVEQTKEKSVDLHQPKPTATLTAVGLDNPECFEHCMFLQDAHELLH